MKLQSLRSAIAGALAIGVSAGAAAAPLGEHINGLYIVPDVPAGGEATGRGLTVHYVPRGPERGTLQFAYYTYDDAGNPEWWAGSTNVTPYDLSVDVDLLNLTGGNFGGAGGNLDINEQRGTATFRFNSCGDISWSFPGEFDDTLTNLNQGVTSNGKAPSSCAVYDSAFEGCPDFATAGVEEGQCVIPGGEYTENLVLTNDTQWVLNGAVYIGTRATPENPDPGNTNSITIEPGTQIIGGTTESILGIQPGAKIFANGTANAPIVFTGRAPASDPDATLTENRWGGLTINGLAPINSCDNPESAPCTSEGEGESGTYGGDDPNDSSGVLRYVRVQFAGNLFNLENELNGIAFQGVGAGTIVENIQVHSNLDDGVEFFGGTVNVRNLVLTDIEDDSIDWTEGWTGRIQNALIVQNQAQGQADFGIEGENLRAAQDREPRSKPWIANATFIGAPTEQGILLYRGSGANLSNILVSGYDACFNLDDEATFLAAGSPSDLSGVTTVENTVFDCASAVDEEAGDPFSLAEFLAAQNENNEADLGLDVDNVFLPEDSEFLSGFPISYPPFDAFFNNADYIGAFGPGPAWTAGWTLQNYTK